MPCSGFAGCGVGCRFGLVPPSEETYSSDAHFLSLPLWVFALFDKEGDGKVSVLHILAGEVVVADEAQAIDAPELAPRWTSTREEGDRGGGGYR